MPLENHLNGFPMILERCSPKLKLGENEKGQRDFIRYLPAQNRQIRAPRANSVAVLL